MTGTIQGFLITSLLI